MMVQYQYNPDNVGRMRAWEVILPVVMFLCGLWGVQRVPWLRVDAVRRMNERSAPLLQRLVQLKYFRIIRLNVDEKCQLGVMRRICQSKSCSVCRCNEKDIPESWTITEKVQTHVHDLDMWANERQQLKHGWVWHVEDEANDKGEYFDISKNIESFTNYNGSYIWRLIYEENCFRPKDYPPTQLCSEEHILYTLISGLHTSISTHLSRFYKNSTGQSAWADLKTGIEESKFHFNTSEYQRRVLQHPDRIRNLVFLYRLLGKAIVNSAKYFHHNFTIQSDDFGQDVEARQLMDQLLRQLEGYDLSPEEKESLKFFTPGNPKVRQYQRYIHNISEILNCVECQKCRLFGKTQTYGIGTALKILLGYPTPYKRNEIVALFNAFNKVSMSVHTYYHHRTEHIDLGYEKVSRKCLGGYKLVAGLMAVLFVWSRYRRDYLDEDRAGKEE